MKKILAAVDFSDVTSEVIEKAKELTKAFGSELYIIHTESFENYYYNNDYYQPTSFKFIEERKKNLLDDLNKLQDNLKNDGIDAKCIFQEGPTVKSIIEEAEKINSDIIVIGSHEHGKLYHMLFGSVRDSLVAHSPCPVLVIPYHEG